MFIFLTAVRLVRIVKRETHKMIIYAKIVEHCTCSVQKIYPFLPNQTIPGLALVDLEAELDEAFRQAVKQITELLLKTFHLGLLGR